MDILFPGRFSILTNVHIDIIRKLLNKYVKEGKLYVGLRIIVNENFTNYDNPFTYYERKEMFNIVFKKEISEGKIFIIPLSYRLNIRKDMKKFCGKIIPVYTRERIWMYGCKIMNIPVIYEKREGISATDVKKKIYEILQKNEKLPESMNEINEKILNFINNEERINRLKNIGKDKDKFGIKKWLKTIMEEKLHI